MTTRGGLGRVTRHSEYYLSDGNVCFLTSDGILFRVHKSFFERESQFFRDLFANVVQGDLQTGSDARPFVLDIASDEFASLLWVWYGRDYTHYQQTRDEWVTILRLSTRWQFHRIRELAIRELDALQLSPAERISIYNEIGINGEPLVSAYVELFRSPRITETDGRLLRMETILTVLRAREDAHRRAHDLGHQNPTSASLGDEELRQIVSRYFRTSLNPRPSGTSTGLGAQASDLNSEPTHGTTATTPTVAVSKPGPGEEDASPDEWTIISHEHDFSDGNE